ncbi:hypothetical protein VTK73DRAFT_5206 [Phialemonium thermophilum]|uniref:Uncharacterized protein n=1 Tax=Phialemonium thermophilum TaxID=223376 RepID=A0ABR3V2Z1_9PEZI
MFSSHGLRGRLLHAALHKQHNRIYSYNAQTEFGAFAPESREAALQFLRMAHFDEGHRLFTYVLTLDGLLRFTETGHEFGIDLLSKHTMHSDVATYIACSGEFFIRRVARERREGHESHDGHEAHGRPSRSSSSRRDSWCHKSHHQQQQQKQEQQEQKQQKQQQQQQQPQQEPRISSSSARRQPPLDPSRYQLIIDNDSGTYRPDKSVLPDLQRFLQRNFPGLAIRAMHCADDELVRLKKEQAELKKRAAGGQRVAMVLNRSPGSSSSSSRGSFSSSDESRLAHLERHGRDERPLRSKKERAYEVLEDPTRLKDWRGMLSSGGGGEKQGGGGGEKQGGGEGGESTRKGA